MTISDTNTSDALLVKKAHPVRGILWGLVFGLGLTVVLVVTTVISLELTQMIVVLAAGTLFGVLWSVFGPAKPPSGPVRVVVVNPGVRQPVSKPLVQHDQPLVVAEPAVDDITPTGIDLAADPDPVIDPDLAPNRGNDPWPDAGAPQ